MSVQFPNEPSRQLQKMNRIYSNNSRGRQTVSIELDSVIIGRYTVLAAVKLLWFPPVYQKLCGNSAVPERKILKFGVLQAHGIANKCSKFQLDLFDFENVNIQRRIRQRVSTYVTIWLDRRSCELSAEVFGSLCSDYLGNSICGKLLSADVRRNRDRDGAN